MKYLLLQIRHWRRRRERGRHYSSFPRALSLNLNAGDWMQGNGIQGLDAVAQLTNSYRAFLRSKVIHQQNALQGIWPPFRDSKWRFHFFFFLIIQVLRPQHENQVAKFNSFVVMQEVELGKQNTSKLLDMERIYCPLRNHSCFDMTQMYPAFLTLLGHSNLFKKIKCKPLGFCTTEDRLLLVFQTQLWSFV